MLTRTCVSLRAEDESSEGGGGRGAHNKRTLYARIRHETTIIIFHVRVSARA